MLGRERWRIGTETVSNVPNFKSNRKLCICKKNFSNQMSGIFEIKVVFIIWKGGSVKFKYLSGKCLSVSNLGPRLKLSRIYVYIPPKLCYFSIPFVGNLYWSNSKTLVSFPSYIKLFVIIIARLWRFWWYIGLQK